MKPIQIWEPKYSTNEVLIGSHKVVTGDNYIEFTKAKHLKGKLYKIDSETIRSHPKQQNGRGSVYVVPFDKLTEVTE